MGSIREDLNRYLFFEFAIEGDESQVSDVWPFQLREAGQTPELMVFELDHEEPYWALAGSSLNFFPKAGMTFEDILLQRSGSAWIDARDPVDLSVSRPDDSTVPPMLERYRLLQTMAESANIGADFEILEGLFLRKENLPLGLFRSKGEVTARLIGISAEPIIVPFPDASPWRRLAWGVGRWLAQQGAVTAT